MSRERPPKKSRTYPRSPAASRGPIRGLGLGVVLADELRRLDTALTPPAWDDQLANGATRRAATSGHPPPQKKADMLKSSLTALARQQLAIAASASIAPAALISLSGSDQSIP